jgi:hypothetical protein
MNVQSDIGVKMSGKIHLQLFFQCSRCGESICLTGVANDYHYPQWYVGEPLSCTEEGLVCYECWKEDDGQGI